MTTTRDQPDPNEPPSDIEPCSECGKQINPALDDYYYEAGCGCAWHRECRESGS